MQTTNPDTFVASKVANALKYSYGDELPVRLPLFNLFSPIKIKFSYDYFS